MYTETSIQPFTKELQDEIFRASYDFSLHHFAKNVGIDIK